MIPAVNIKEQHYHTPQAAHSFVAVPERLHNFNNKLPTSNLQLIGFLRNSVSSKGFLHRSCGKVFQKVVRESLSFIFSDCAGFAGILRIM